MFGRGVSQDTARTRCKEMPGSLPLPMWHLCREPTEPAATSLVAEKRTAPPSHDRCQPEEVEVVYPSGTFLAIKASHNAIDPFWLVRLDEDLCGQCSADGILYDNNFSATYLESVSSSCSMYDMGRKVPKTKAKPDLILTDVCLSRPSSSDSQYLLGEEEMRRIMFIVQPTDLEENSSESENDGGDDDYDQEATRRLVVRTSGQHGHGLRPRAGLFRLTDKR